MKRRKFAPISLVVGLLILVWLFLWMSRRAIAQGESPWYLTLVLKNAKSPGLVVQGSVQRADGAGVPGVKIYRSYAAYPGVVIATTGVDGSYRSGFMPIPGDEMVTVWAELAGYDFVPQNYFWRHYFGYELRNLAFIALPGTGETVTPTSTAAQGELPDLIVDWMRIELETGGDCNFGSTNLGVRVWFSNIDAGDAGPFVVEVNAEILPFNAGLPSGESGSLWFPGFVPFDENTAFVDFTNLVAESDEGNNQLSQTLPIPTLPPTCTPTPTSTLPQPLRQTPAPPTPNPTD